MEEKPFKPFIPSDRILPELTPISLCLGLGLAVLFGAANAYLGVQIGLTISASVPAAVISMGIIRVVMKRDSILENNMVQTIGSAGESIAGGAIFTFPALFMWARESGTIARPSFWVIAIITLCAGILGIIFMIPLRSALIVEEHGVLPFPEGTACAQVLLAGEEGGEKSKIVFSGLGISAVYEFLTDGLSLFPGEIDWSIKRFGTNIGADILPALASVGYICGKKISSFMLAGGVLGWLVIIPMIHCFGGSSIIAPATVPMSKLDAWDIWSNYIRYIGAGAVAMGGIISLVKSFPTIAKTFRKALGGFGHKEAVQERTNRDLPMKFLLPVALIIILVIWLLPAIPVGLVGAFIIVIFGFFFATVSSRMVGLVGSSNTPVSGMVIATLLIATVLLKETGSTGFPGMISAICIGTVICIVSAMAADLSQDLKTGYILGATPRNQQIGEIAGCVVSAFAIGGILYLLDEAWGLGTKELPAPQATLMKLVVEGVMFENLPWNLVFAGIGLAVAIEVLEIPVLPVAIGLYLPIHLSVPVFIGGLIRNFFDKKGEDGNAITEKGILYTSGLIAGEGLIGVLLAIFALIRLSNGKTLLKTINMGNVLGMPGSVVFFVLLLASIVFFTRNKKKNA